MPPIKSSDRAVNNAIEKTIISLKEAMKKKNEDVKLVAQNRKIVLTAKAACINGDCDVSIYFIHTNSIFHLFPRREGDLWETSNSEIISLLEEIQALAN